MQLENQPQVFLLFVKQGQLADAVWFWADSIGNSRNEITTCLFAGADLNLQPLER